jgi:hypothetical protein
MSTITFLKSWHVFGTTENLLITIATSGELSPNRDGTRYDRVYIVNASG